MKNSIELEGMIISVMPVGEQDRRVTVLTRERGKIVAFARGARRQSSPLMGQTRVFAYGSFKLIEGRHSYYFVGANISRFFDEITSDIEATCYGSYFLEMATYYTREALREPDILKLLYISLIALNKPSIPRCLTRRIYELRLMVVAGEYDEKPDRKLSEAGRYTWNYIIHTPLERLYTFTVKESVINEIALAVDDMMYKYIDREMKSLAVLKSLNRWFT